MNNERRRRASRITADELLTRLEADPSYVARMAELERSCELNRISHIREATAVVRDLNAAGYPVETVEQLYHERYDYRSAIPILLRWLTVKLDADVKETIIRALSVKWAKPSAAPLLVAEFDKRNDDGDTDLRWVIGNALSVVADDSVYREIVNLVKDRRHGKAREMLAVALGNMKTPQAIDVLIGLLDDEEVAGHAIIALGKLKAGKARLQIEQFLQHPKSWVRTEARRALAKIDKASK